MEATLNGLETTTAVETETAEKLKLRITPKFLLAMLALTICTGEIHEQVHIQTGRFICGGYGARDFNVWTTAADCSAPAWTFLATLAGPLWSYLVMWTGVFLLLRAKTATLKTVGLTLIFAPLPFARIFTVLMGGGDEKVVFRRLLQNDLSASAIKILAAAFVILVCLPPILIAWKSIKNRFAVFYIAGFAALPLVVLGVYVLTILNGLLEKGFLSSTTVIGTPQLIVVHFVLMSVVLIFCRRWLLKLNAEF